MLHTLLAFAKLYEASVSARKGSTRDFTLDYEKFLRSALLNDGDDRELAERELKAAESQSNGLLRIDRHSRSQQPERLRLSAQGGETWLFQQLGLPSPEQRRHELAQSFLKLRDLPAPERWASSWYRYFDQLHASALLGESTQPFSRENPETHFELARTLLGVLSWQGPTLIRYASSALCGNSKTLQTLEPRLKIALAAITGSDRLEDFGILRKPRQVTFHGPITIQIEAHSLDFSALPGPASLSETNLNAHTQVHTTAPLALTVENEDTFHELAATNPGILLILTSYAGSAVRHFIQRLPPTLPLLHFGDLDPAGLDILRDLREKTRRDHQLLSIPLPESISRRPATQSEIQTLHRLLESNLPTLVHQQAQQLLLNGIPENYEQEHLPIEAVWQTIQAWQPS